MQITSPQCSIKICTPGYKRGFRLPNWHKLSAYAEKEELFETLLLLLVLIDGKLQNRLYYNRALQLHHSATTKKYI